MELLDVEHLKGFTSQRSEPLVDDRLDRPSHELEEATGLVRSLVGLPGGDRKGTGHIVNASIAHLFNLHQDRNDQFNFTAEVVSETLLMGVEDLNERAEVPLLRVGTETLLWHLLRRQRDNVDALISKRHLELFLNVHAHFENELINQLRHEHFDLVLHLKRRHLLCDESNVCVRQHGAWTLLF